MKFAVFFATLFLTVYGTSGAWIGRVQSQPNQLAAPRLSTTNHKAQQMTIMGGCHPPVATLNWSNSEDLVQSNVKASGINTHLQQFDALLAESSTSQQAPRAPSFRYEEKVPRASGGAMRPAARLRDSDMARDPGERPPQPPYYLPARPSFKPKRTDTPDEKMTVEEAADYDAFIKRMTPMGPKHFKAAEGIQLHLHHLELNGTSLKRSTRELKESERAKSFRVKKQTQVPVKSLMEDFEVSEPRVHFAPDVVSETRYYKLNNNVKNGWLSAEEVEANAAEKRKCSILVNEKNKMVAVDAGLHGPAENRIVLWGLSKNTTCKDLIAYFCPRNITHVTLVQNVLSSVNTAFIEFLNRKDAEEAVTEESSSEHHLGLKKLGNNVGLDVCPASFHIFKRDIHVRPSDPSSTIQQHAVNEMATSRFWKDALQVPISYLEKMPGQSLRIVLHRAKDIEVVQKYAEDKLLKVTLFRT